MIGKLTGKLAMRGSDHVMIDTGGVGYVVYCSERTLSALPGIGETVALFTDLVVREDLLQLYGFQTITEREWHKLLQSVQGVGAKAALAIQGTLGSDGVGRAIALGDVSAIRAAPGVGPKLAQRVANELKDKAPAIMSMGEPGLDAASNTASAGPVLVDVGSATGSGAAATADAMSALVNLGYAQGDAAAAVAQSASETPDADAGALIKAALRLLAPKG